MNYNENIIKPKLDHIELSSTPNAGSRFKRKEQYLCLCSCDKSGSSCLTNALCGCPMYICCMSFAVSLSMAGVIAWLAYASWQLSTTNKSFGVQCSSNVDCNNVIGLYCPTSNTINRCNCTSGKYWNGTSCSQLFGMNDTGCFYNYHCDSSKNLKCLNGKCICVTPRLWNNAYLSCMYDYKGCYSDSSGNTLFSGDSSNTINSFVEACSEGCYLNNYVYAMVRNTGSVNECKCQNSTPANLQASGCTNLLCPSYSSPNGLSCGDMNNNNYRAAYQLR